MKYIWAANHSHTHKHTLTHTYTQTHTHLTLNHMQTFSHYLPLLKVQHRLQRVPSTNRPIKTGKRKLSNSGLKWCNVIGIMQQWFAIKINCCSAGHISAYFSIFQRIASVYYEKHQSEMNQVQIKLSRIYLSSFSYRDTSSWDHRKAFSYEKPSFLSRFDIHKNNQRTELISNL